MTVQLKDLINRLPADEQKAMVTQAAELIAEEMSLRDLRVAHQLTQQWMAESLGIGQEGVSRLEKRTDLLLSTLRGYVEALGGGPAPLSGGLSRPAPRNFVGAG